MPVDVPAERKASPISDGSKCGSSKILNVMSVDVEDYFHVSAFESQVSKKDWDSFPCRIERNIYRVLELFQEYNTRGTFFILGWVAQRFPGLVREIAAAGHEIGSHGFSHQRIYFQTPNQYRSDIRDSRNLLMDQVQKPVVCYRAPSFSIVKNTVWALEILAEEGFTIDSSIFPVRHDLYGIPNSERYPHWRKTTGNGRIFEFPPSTFRMAGNNWAVGGGGYLRIFPYALTRWGLHCINRVENQAGMVYFHPWEIDSLQPRIPAGLLSRFRHYTNISKMEDKIKCLLRDFNFTSLSDSCARIEAFKSGNNQTVAI